jgi:hypothetical protein
MAKKDETREERRARLENAYTVVFADDVQRTKYAQSPNFTGFSKEHAAMLAAWVDGSPKFAVVPLRVQRWAQTAEHCPSDPMLAWQDWLVCLQRGDFDDE